MIDRNTLVLFTMILCLITMLAAIIDEIITNLPNSYTTGYNDCVKKYNELNRPTHPIFTNGSPFANLTITP